MVTGILDTVPAVRVGTGPIVTPKFGAVAAMVAEGGDTIFELLFTKLVSPVTESIEPLKLGVVPAAAASGTIGILKADEPPLAAIGFVVEQPIF